jgi:hypothetical protein
MLVATGICILSSFTIFPESVGHSFRAKFPGVLTPLSVAVSSVEELFLESQRDPMPDHLLDSRDPIVIDRLANWAEKSTAIRAQLLSSLAGLPPLRAQRRYLHIDFRHSRLSNDDLRELFDRLAVVQARSAGLAFFFDILVSNARHAHLDSSVYTVKKVIDSRASSRPGSFRDATDEDEQRSHHTPSFIHRRSSPAGLGHSHRGSHVSLMDRLRKVQQPVGLYESQRYMELEKAFDE